MAVVRPTMVQPAMAAMSMLCGRRCGGSDFNRRAADGTTGISEDYGVHGRRGPTKATALGFCFYRPLRTEHTCAVYLIASRLVSTRPKTSAFHSIEKLETARRLCASREYSEAVRNGWLFG